jgi:integrase
MVGEVLPQRLLVREVPRQRPNVLQLLGGQLSLDRCLIIATIRLAVELEAFHPFPPQLELQPPDVERRIKGLRVALKDAMLMGLIQRNVAELVRAPRRSAREMKTLSEEQATLFLKATEHDRFAALFVLALTTGMREGELLGLRWQDINFERATVQVQLNVQEKDGRFALAELKTAYSRRNIGLSRIAIAALRQHKAQQDSQRSRLGQAWVGQLDLVCPNSVGGLMIPDNMVKRSFKPLLANAGLPEIRFHDLRPTAATLLLSRGVHPKVVSEMLGHADISITLRIYAHVTPHMQQAAVVVMDALFYHGPEASA